MKAKNNVKENNNIIFHTKNSRGQREEYDGCVLSVHEDNVHVCYLNGYRSYNETVPWENIIAKVDKRKSYVKLEEAPYSGHFEVFEK